MELTDHSLKQLTPEFIKNQSHDDLICLSLKLLKDLQESRDRLNQNSSNSSRPPGSMPPWEKTDQKENDDTADKNEPGADPDVQGAPRQPDDSPSEAPSAPEESNDTNTADPEGKKRSPGKQPGAPGFGKTWNPSATEEAHHCHPEQCCCCDRALNPDNCVAYTSFHQVDIGLGDATHPGLVVKVTPYILYENTCICGHHNRYNPQAEALGGVWEGIQLSEWRWIAPTLAAFIAHLKMKFRLPIRKIQEMLGHFGLHLSTGCIQRCYEESGAAVAPLEAPIQEALLEEMLVHADETIWIENNKTLWLWVFNTASVVYYCVGKRTKQLFQEVLNASFCGWLMSDGYGAYRHYDKRLRCWAHLLRKARGLAESMDATGRAFGQQAVSVLETLMDAIYDWRAQNHPEEHTQALATAHQSLLETFKETCEQYGDSAIQHEKTRNLAREFLNDWAAIFRIVEHPCLPLTNNEAERSLRPWVLMRKICYGSRSQRGTKTFTLLASVIDTCRRRGVDSIRFLAHAIDAARKGAKISMISQAAEGT